MFSVHIRVRVAVTGSMRGARPETATRATPARRGAPRYKYFSCLAVAPTKEIAPIIDTVYRPARARIAGFINRSGERTAACARLKVPQSAYFCM